MTEIGSYSEDELELIISMLDDDVQLFGPTIETPFHGRGSVEDVLRTAMKQLHDVRFIRIIVQDDLGASLFDATVRDQPIHGSVFTVVNAAGLIVEIQLMLRPLAAAHVVATAMSAALSVTS